MAKHVIEGNLKTINGQSLIGQGNIQILTQSHGVPPSQTAGDSIQRIITDIFLGKQFQDVKSGDCFYIRSAKGGGGFNYFKAEMGVKNSDEATLLIQGSENGNSGDMIFICVDIDANLQMIRYSKRVLQGTLTTFDVDEE